MLWSSYNDEVSSRNQFGNINAYIIEESITRTLESVENSLFPVLLELNNDKKTKRALENAKKQIDNIIFFAPHIRQVVILKDGQTILDSNSSAKGAIDLKQVRFPDIAIDHYATRIHIGDVINGRFLPQKSQRPATSNKRKLIPILIEYAAGQKTGVYQLLVALNVQYFKNIFFNFQYLKQDGYAFLRLDGYPLLTSHNHAVHDYIVDKLKDLTKSGKNDGFLDFKKGIVPIEQYSIHLSNKYPLAVAVKTNHSTTFDLWVDNNLILIFGLITASFIILISAYFLYTDYHRTRRLRKEVHLLSTAVHQSPVSVLITEIDGTIQYANPAFQHIFGYEKKDWLGATPAILKSGKTKPAVYEGLWSAILNGEPWQGEFLNRTKDNRLVPTISAISPIFDSDNQITHLIGVLSDITPQKALQHKAMEATKQAKLANEAKSNFLATMSHELRTPMTGIRGIIDLLKSQGHEISVDLDLLQDLDNSSSALMMLLNDILDLSKIEAGKMQIELTPCNPAEIVQNVIHLFTKTADLKNIALVCNASPDDKNWFICDSLRLRQIISNLVSNAVKFTNAGQVSIELSYTMDNDEHETLNLNVEDTGIGMDEEQLARIFDPFTQADSSTTRQYGGTGLGLSITKQLCNLLQGTLEVQSQLNKGSRFSVKIPVERCAADHPLIAKGQETGHLNILLAEDNLVNRKVISGMLNKNGHTVITAENGKIAVSKAAQQQFDIILMDIQMPEMDGLDATRLIRKSSPYNSKTPIIALTADAFPEHHKHFKETGIDEIATKPIKWDLLETTIAILLSQK